MNWLRTIARVVDLQMITVMASARSEVLIKSQESDPQEPVPSYARKVAYS
jgi:hypothetical protein